MKLNLIKNKIFKNYLVLVLAFLILEIIMRALLSLPIFDWASLRIFLGINIISLTLGTLISLLPEKITNILNIIFIGFSSIYAFAQIGFNNFMGTFISVNSSSQLDKVWSYLIDYISGYDWTYYLLLIPLILVIVYYIFFNKKIKNNFYF